MKGPKMEYEVKQDGEEYRVEAINHEVDGEIYVAVFSGPEAEARARRYAAYKNDGDKGILRAASGVHYLRTNYSRMASDLEAIADEIWTNEP
jgi:hypothetical protein